MEYDYLVSPFDFDSFDNINKTQDQKYFEWYIAQSESRIDLLGRFINENKSEHINLDNSPESLIHLWKWFEDEILSGEQHFANERELTFDELKIITDISFYFAAVILRNQKAECLLINRLFLDLMRVWILIQDSLCEIAHIDL